MSRRSAKTEIAALQRCLELAPRIMARCGMPETSMNEKIDRAWCEIYNATRKIESVAETALRQLGVRVPQQHPREINGPANEEKQA